MSLWKRSHRIVSLAATVLAMSVLAACGGGSNPGGSQNARAEINAMMPQGLSSADVARVRVEVRGSGIPTPIGVDLTLQGGTWQGTIVDIPAGVERTFEATAFDAGGTAIYRGQAGPITVAPGGTVSVAILLQQVNPPPVFENVAPTIDSLVVSANQVSPGGTLTLTATAHDDNPGDTLTYAWIANAGTFSAPTALTTNWVAPSTQGVQTLRFEVTDSKGTKATISVDVSVQPAGSTGSAGVTVGFNTWPSVTKMLAAPSVLTPNVAAQIAAVVSDPDGDTLSFSWGSDCPGSFSEFNSPTPSYTLVGPPLGLRCTLFVSVTDGRGGQSSGSLSLTVGPVPRANVAPQVDSTFKSSEQAASGEIVTVGLTAHDPEGTPLTLSWTTEQGVILATRSTSSSTEVDWQAPLCLNGPAVLTASIRDGGGATTRQQFSITPRPGSSCNGQAVSGFRNTHRVRSDGTVTQVPYDLSGVTLGAWVPTGDGQGYTWHPGTGQANGTFLIPNVPSTPYLLQYNASFIWATSRTLDLSTHELGRPDLEFEPEGTQLAINLGGLFPWQDTDDLQFYAPNAGIGYFSTLYCSFPEYLPPAAGSTNYVTTLDYYESIFGCGSSPGRIDPAKGDMLYVTHLSSRSDPATGLEFQEVRAGMQTSSLGPPNTGTLQLNGWLSPLPTISSTVDYPASSFEALALAAHPTATLSLTLLNLGTLPGFGDFGIYSGWPDLAIASGPPGRGDLVTTLTYGHPYPGSWNRFIVAQSRAAVRFSVDLPGGGTSTPRAYPVYTYALEPLTGNATTIQPRVGPPRDLRINGAVATGNLTGVGLTPLASWTPPSVGTADYYAIRVYELFVAGTSSTSRLQIASLVTTQPQIRLPPGLLEPGKSYHLQIASYFKPGADLNKPYLERPMYHMAMSVTGRFQP